MDIISSDNLYYQRFIDDIFSIFISEEAAQNYIIKFNSICPQIQFEAITIGKQGIFLDFIFKIELNKIISNIYQKPINKYLYVPAMSAHSITCIKAFIKQELCRYRLYCSHEEDYLSIATLFRNRLVARGYVSSFLDPLFLNVPQRQHLLDKLLAKQTQHSPKKILNAPLITLQLPCIHKKIPWKDIFKIPPDLAMNPRFMVTYPCTDIEIATRQINGLNIGIGKRSNPSLALQLTHRPIKKSKS